MIDVDSPRGDRVRAARVLFGYTQVEFARLVGLSQAQLSRIERGEVPVDGDLIDAIGEYVRVPPAFLLQASPSQGEGSLRFRKKARTRAKETERVQQLVVEAHRVCNQVATLLRLPPPALPQMQPDEPVTSEAVERLALECRLALGIGIDEPVPHVTRALERAFVFVVPARLPNYEPDAGAVGHSGASLWNGPWESPLIAYIPDQPGDRLRHTLSHELGHLVLHAHRPIPVDRDAERAAEREADEFASAFLLPLERAREVFGAAGRLTLDKLKVMKAGWGISVQGLIMRAATSEMIDGERVRSLYRQLSARGWRKSEPVEVHLEGPQLLGQVFERLYGSDIPWSKLQEEFGLPSDVLKRLAGF